MLKIYGAILCIFGCSGFGILKIAGWKRDKEHIVNWILLFQKIRSRILYQKETLEEGCIHVGRNENDSRGSVLLRIGMRARGERQMEFSGIWKEEMEQWCAENLGQEAAKEMLLQFPDYVKEADEQLQTELFSFYIEELRKEKEKMEHWIAEKQKPVISIALITGVMIAILLI